MRYLLWGMVVVLLIGGLVACNAKKETPIKRDTASLETPVSHGIVKGDLVSTLTQETTSEDNLNFVYTIKNQTENVETLKFNSGKKFDYIIKNKQGENVYQYSKEMMFTQALSEEELKQGAELRFNLSVKTKLKAGTYTLKAWLTSNRDEDYKQTISFEIK